MAAMLAATMVTSLSTSTTLFAADRLVAPQHANAQDAGDGNPAAPYRTLAFAMKKLRPGDHLSIAEGTYREALIFPAKPWTRIDAGRLENADIDPRYLLKSAETLIEGMGKVLIKGSDIVDGWQAEGDGRYGRSWPVEPQQVFFDGKSLAQIGGTIFGGFPEKANHPLLSLHKAQNGIWPGRVSGTQDNMPAGSFYYRAETRTLYIHPGANGVAGHVIEVSVRPNSLMANGVTDLTVKNLRFEHGNTSTTQRTGLVWVTGLRITLTGLHIRQCDSTGISLMGDDITLSDSSVVGCGQLGIKARGQRMRLIGNVTDGNNTRGFNKWWEAGGIKLIGNGGLQHGLISRHQAAGNLGDGIWFDWKNRDNTVEHCLVAYNGGFGIHYEASDQGRVIDNVVVANGQRGIYLPHASDSTVAYNLVANNGLQGIAIVDEGRRDPDGRFDFSARGNRVFSNIIAWNKEPLILPSVLADNASDGNVFIGDAGERKPGLGWRHMFHEDLARWTPRTGQDHHSVEMAMPIDEAFSAAIGAHELTLPMDWYTGLRARLTPPAIDQGWHQRIPVANDRRPGPAIASPLRMIGTGE